jgi:hypothetical protein
MGVVECSSHQYKQELEAKIVNPKVSDSIQLGPKLPKSLVSTTTGLEPPPDRSHQPKQRYTPAAEQTPETNPKQSIIINTPFLSKRGTTHNLNNTMLHPSDNKNLPLLGTCKPRRHCAGVNKWDKGTPTGIPR